MNNFTLTVTRDKSSATVQMAGQLDENAVLSSLDLSEITEVEIDLSRISRINSKGVRIWLMWVNSLDQKKKYFLRNCPQVFMNLVNMINDLIPSWMKVRSVEIPYFCPKCAITFGTIIDIKDNNTLASPLRETAICANCGGPADIDTLPDLYAKFFKKTKS